MKNITMIAAIGKNNELGKDNKLIWYIPEDLKFFKQQTMNKPLVMGINTLNSLPKLLPGRKHLVLTHQDLEENEQLQVFHDKEKLLEYISTLDQEVMIIGGASIYKQMLEYSDKLVLTKLDKSFDADTFFPEIDESKWNEEVISTHSYEDINYKHLVYKRK